jgi:nitrate/nitrite transporter NarK
MFLLEGLPAVFLGLVAFFYLLDKPEDAKWLSELEKAALVADLKRTKNQSEQSFSQLLRSVRIYGYAITYFCLICGLYAVGFWLPTILNTAGVTDLMENGFYSAIPYMAAIIAMYFLSQRSDRYGERRWHSIIAIVGGAIAFIVAIYAESSFVITLISITIATALIFAAYSVFWAIPTDVFKDKGAAGGIAFVNSIGLLGGFLVP